MTTSQNPIDFTEMVSAVKGEGLEQLSRLLGEKLGLQPDWSGRGADGGRDLIFTSYFDKPLCIHVRWLVSCKDFAQSGNSVKEEDIPNPEAKMRQHNAKGYLVVTTTTISTGAKAMLDGISKSGEWFTDVWDGARLTQWLLDPQYDGLLKQFFPLSHAALVERDGNGADTVGTISDRFAQTTHRHSRSLLIIGINDPLPRSEVSHIEDALGEGKSILVTGDSGTGKSGIAHALCGPRSNPDRPVLLLDARSYTNLSSISDLAGRISLAGPVLSGIKRLGGRTGCRLIIDQLDSVANSPAGMAFADLAIQASQLPGVEVVVLSRRKEAFETSLLSHLTQSGFVELECNELTEGAVRAALAQIGLACPPDDLVQMAKNLLNLSLVAQIKMELPDFNFETMLDEVALWRGYVDVLQVSESGGPFPDLGERIIGEAYRLAREGLQAENRACVIVAPKSVEQRRLESWGIIFQEEGYSYQFKHENLQDFLYAQHATKCGYMVADVLKEIASHRTRNIFAWMNKLYQATNSSHRVPFMKEVLGV